MDTAPLCLSCIAQAEMLLIAANGAPVIARKLLGARFSLPVDGGYQCSDRQPLFGASKTWRGLAAGIAAATLLAPLLSLPPSLGALFGAVSLSGDLLASFAKRRLGYAPSSRTRWLDAPLEALLPATALKTPLALGSAELVTVVGVFFLLEALFSPLLFRLHIRNRPY